jgi:hypothetical protein
MRFKNRETLIKIVVFIMGFTSSVRYRSSLLVPRSNPRAMLELAKQ